MKIFRLIVAAVFFGMLLLSSSALAVDENYFNGDKNYIFFGYTQGMGYFVITNTLNVEEFAPPIYIISVDVISVSNYVNGGTKMMWRHTERFKYDYSTRKMYLYTPNGGEHLRKRYENQYGRNKQKMAEANKIDWNSEWTYIQPDVYYGAGVRPVQVGEIAFALAYKLKFYDCYKSDFYDGVRGVVGEIKDSI